MTLVRGKHWWDRFLVEFWRHRQVKGPIFAHSDTLFSGDDEHTEKKASDMKRRALETGRSRRQIPCHQRMSIKTKVTSLRKQDKIYMIVDSLGQGQDRYDHDIPQYLIKILRICQQEKEGVNTRTLIFSCLSRFNRTIGTYIVEGEETKINANERWKKSPAKPDSEIEKNRLCSQCLSSNNWFDRCARKGYDFEKVDSESHEKNILQMSPQSVDRLGHKWCHRPVGERDWSVAAKHLQLKCTKIAINKSDWRIWQMNIELWVDRYCKLKESSCQREQKRDEIVLMKFNVLPIITKMNRKKQQYMIDTLASGLHASIVLSNMIHTARVNDRKSAKPTDEKPVSIDHLMYEKEWSPLIVPFAG